MNKLFLFAVLFLLLGACRTPVQDLPEADDDLIAEKFVRANRYMYQRHQDYIAAFVERTGMEAEITPSGLWIEREKAGTGKRIENGSRVRFSFESTLLDGTTCYSTPDSKPKIILVGKGDIESGVEEGLLKLREGAEATFLIPPHLAHGNFGDRDKIPGNSVLIYRLRVLKVQ